MYGGISRDLEFIAIRQVLIVLIIVIVGSGVRLRRSACRSACRSARRRGQDSGGGDRRLVSGGRRNDNRASNTENLTNVDVAALCIDLGIVLVEESGVHAVSSGDGITGIALNHGCGPSERVDHLGLSK